MELRQLRYVEQVARYSNFSKAASELHVTQQTLSQQIMKLEDEIGFPIFERSTRSVKLTDRGVLILQKINAVLVSYDELSEQIESLQSRNITTIQLGVLPTFSSMHALEAIHDFQSQCQGITINLQIHRSGTLLDMLLRGQIDSAIANISSDEIERIQQKFYVEPFAEDYVCAIVSEQNSLALRQSIKLSDLDHQTLLLLEKGSSIRKHIEQLIQRNQITPSGIIDCTEIYSMMGLLNTNAGIGFLSSKVASQYLNNPIRCIAIEPPLKSSTALIFSKRNPNSEKLQLLLQCMRLQTIKNVLLKE